MAPNEERLFENGVREIEMQENNSSRSSAQDWIAPSEFATILSICQLELEANSEYRTTLISDDKFRSWNV